MQIEIAFQFNNKETVYENMRTTGDKNICILIEKHNEEINVLKKDVTT